MASGPVPAPARRDRWLHRVFAAGLVLKGVFAGIEVLAGTLLLLFGRHAAAFAEAASTRATRIPPDPVAARIAHLAAALSSPDEHFFALFFLAHGLVKGIAVVALLRGVPRACPFAVSVLSAFVLYQLHRYVQSGSVALLVVSALDLVIIGLILREHRPDRRGAA